MKKLWLLTFILITTILLVGCRENVNPANAVITMDINPSIEITTNARGKVASVTPLNDDAQTLLMDTDFEGDAAVDVVVEIAELARQFGYLKGNAENALVVTTEMDNELRMNRVQSILRNRIKDHLDQKNIPTDIIDGNALIVQADIDMANQLGISVGKYRIIKIAMSLDVELTYEEALSMSVSELLGIIREHRTTLKDFASDHVRLAFLQLQSNAKAAFHYLRVSYIETQANLMLLTNPTGFDALLVDSDLDAQGLVALYSDYVDAIESIEIPSPEAYISSIQAKLDADETIQAKNTELEALKAEFKVLYEEYRGDRSKRAEWITEAQAIFMDYMALKAEIDLLVKAYVDAENIPSPYLFFYQNGELDIILLENFMDDYREIRENYRQQFLDHQVDLAAFEELFTNTIKVQLQVALQQYQQVLNQFRIQMAQISIEARMEFRYEHLIRQQTQQNNG